METRTHVQVRVWSLMLNDMRSPKIEQVTVAAMSLDKDKLISFYESLKCERYADGRFMKGFSKSSPLEWFNQFFHDGDYRSSREGIFDKWMSEKEWNNHIADMNFPIIL